MSKKKNLWNAAVAASAEKAREQAGAAQPGGGAASGALKRAQAYGIVSKWCDAQEFPEFQEPRCRARLRASIRDLPVALVADGVEATFAFLGSRPDDKVHSAVTAAMIGCLPAVPGVGQQPAHDSLCDRLLTLAARPEALKRARLDLVTFAEQLKYFGDALLATDVSLTPSDAAAGKPRPQAVER